jgi:hypothetical protein
MQATATVVVSVHTGNATWHAALRDDDIRADPSKPSATHIKQNNEEHGKPPARCDALL